jgi:DNA-binding MarR family transcriptional regulator
MWLEFPTNSSPVGHLIRRAQQIHTLLWNSEVSDEVTSPQFLVLVALSRAPGMDQRTLGVSVSLDRSTTADVVDRLTGRGLLERSRDPDDRRRYILGLTAEGAKLVDAISPRTETMNDHLINVLPAEDQAELIRLLSAFVYSAELLVQEKSDDPRMMRPRTATI